MPQRTASAGSVPTIINASFFGELPRKPKSGNFRENQHPDNASSVNRRPKRSLDYCVKNARYRPDDVLSVCEGRGEGIVTASALPSLALIHPSAWNRYSPKFV